MGAAGVTRGGFVCARGPGGSRVLQHRPADSHHQGPDGGEGLPCHTGQGAGSRAAPGPEQLVMGRGRREEGGGRRNSVCLGESQRACKGGELSSSQTAQQSPRLGDTQWLFPAWICSLCGLGPRMPSLDLGSLWWDTEMLRIAHPFPSWGKMRSVWRYGGASGDGAGLVNRLFREISRSPGGSGHF